MRRLIPVLIILVLISLFFLFKKSQRPNDEALVIKPYEEPIPVCQTGGKMQILEGDCLPEWSAPKSDGQGSICNASLHQYECPEGTAALGLKIACDRKYHLLSDKKIKTSADCKKEFSGYIGHSKYRLVCCELKK